MDVWLHQAFRIMAMPLFAAAWVTVFVGIVRHERARRRDPSDRAAIDRIHRRVTTIALLCMGGLLLSAFVASTAVDHRFAALTSPRPAAVELRRDERSLTLRDPREIDEMFSLIESASGVSAHHSHPTAPVFVALPASGYVYSLGRDSERPDELWLGWAGYPGSGAPGDLGVIRHFRSSELIAWLDAHDMR